MTEGLAGHMNRRINTELILAEVAKERSRQDHKWGEQNHNPFKWLAILCEEVGEVSKAACDAPSLWDGQAQPKPNEMDNYREELIQVAAVAVSMVESLDRDKWRKTEKEAVNVE